MIKMCDTYLQVIVFFNLAFGSVVVVVLLVIVGIMGLKHVQMRRREFDKSEFIIVM